MKLHEPTFGEDEIAAAVEVMRGTFVTCGEKVRQLESAFCMPFGFANGVSCNSGSSANLLAVAALCNPMTPDYMRPGDEVIVPALSWSTTVWPLVQHGLIPVFVDCDDTFGMDANEVERAIGPRTRGIMPVHIYGNAADMVSIDDIAAPLGLKVVEDCCEAMGSKLGGIEVGHFSHIATFSFYFSHHMTTLEGGICTTYDDELSELLRVLRSHGWTREMQGAKPDHPGIDPKFTFINQGYNLRLTEVAAAIGLVQLPKLAGFVEARRRNAHYWLGIENEHLTFQKERGESSWFGFPVIVEDAEHFKRYLHGHGIETRPIASGNMAEQPGMKLYPHRVVGDLKMTNRVWRNCVSWGCHQAVTQEQRERVKAIAEAYAPPR